VAPVGSPAEGTGGDKGVEAKYPALMFKQQLTAYVEKLYSMIRDSVEKSISPTLRLLHPGTPSTDDVPHYTPTTWLFSFFSEHVTPRRLSLSRLPCCFSPAGLPAAFCWSVSHLPAVKPHPFFHPAE